MSTTTPRTPPPSPGLRRSRRRGPRKRVQLALFGVLAIAILVYGVFTKRIPFIHGYRVTAVFRSSNQLTPGFSPVRIAGVTVGKVVGVSAGPGATTRVTMELSDEALPLHRDARARIRPRLFLEGGFYVDLDPGSPSGPVLHDGGTIPLGQTALPVQFDQILSAFDGSTRASFHRLVGQFDLALGHGGARALSRTWKPLVPLLRDGSQVAEAARGEHAHDPSAIIEGSSRVTGALAAHEAALRGLVTNLARTTTTLAAHDTQVAGSIGQLNGLLTELPPFLDTIQRGVPAVRRFVAALRPSLRIAPPVLDHTSALLDQAGALVSRPELPALLDRLEPPLRRLPGLEQRLDRLFPLVTPVSDCVRDKAVPVLQAKAPDGPLSTGYPVYLDLAHSLVGLASAGQNFDGNGYAVRYLAGAGDTSITTGSAPGVGQLTGLSQSPVEGSRPQWLGPGVQPPLRPDVPCARDAVADLSQRTGARSVSSARRVSAPKGGSATPADVRSAVAQAVRGLRKAAAP